MLQKNNKNKFINYWNIELNCMFLSFKIVLFNKPKQGFIKKKGKNQKLVGRRYKGPFSKGLFLLAKKISH